jgi:hypothetical protein
MNTITLSLKNIYKGKVNRSKLTLGWSVVDQWQENDDHNSLIAENPQSFHWKFNHFNVCFGLEFSLERMSWNGYVAWLMKLWATVETFCYFLSRRSVWVRSSKGTFLGSNRNKTSDGARNENWSHFLSLFLSS